MEIKTGEMFEQSERKQLSSERDVEHSWFFKVLNELFSPYKELDQNELLNLIREKYGKFLQCEELLQLKTQVEIILGLPKNCSKAIIINKIKDLRTSSIMSQSDSEVGVKIQGNVDLICSFLFTFPSPARVIITLIKDFDLVNKNFEAYEEMKVMFETIKSSLKLSQTATFTETLKSVMKRLVKKKKPKLNPPSFAMKRTKIDLDPSSKPKGKLSPSRENRSPALPAGPSSARNDRTQKTIFSKINQPMVISSISQLSQQQVGVKKKKPALSTSCKKRSPKVRKVKPLK